MPHIDGRSGEVVIRIIYDGPPMAGKTTNIHKLASSISLQRRGNPMSPGTSASRTEFFDWMDFTGGYLDGRRVRCQIITVPGQPSLLHRRRYLLESADAIVFVSDSRRETFPFAVSSLSTTVRIVEALTDAIPVGMVLQANKQDLPEAQTPQEVARALGVNTSIPVTGSIAERGEGVMATFLLAVRLATDRVRALLLKNTLAELPAESMSPDSTHSALLEIDMAVTQKVGPQADAARIEAEHAEAVLNEAWRLYAAGSKEQFLDNGAQASSAAGRSAESDFTEPVSSAKESFAYAQRRNLFSSMNSISIPQAQEINSGHIWPPVKGRSALALATSEHLTSPDIVCSWAPAGAIELRSANGWVLHSSERWIFASEADGRLKLMVSVRRMLPHLENSPEGRSLLLAKDHDHWRLWLLTPSIRTIQEDALAALEQNDVQALANVIERTVVGIEELASLHISNGEIPAGADGIALEAGRLVMLALDEGEDQVTLESANPVAQLSALIEERLQEVSAEGLRGWFHEQGRQLFERALAGCGAERSS